jgi:hypothetical protein
LTEHYRLAGKAGVFTLLQKKADATAVEENNLCSVHGTMGSIIGIPADQNSTLYGRIDIRSSLYGKAKGLLFKPGNVYLQFVFGDGQRSGVYKLITSTAKDDVLLSAYIGTTRDFEAWINGELTRNVSGIIISTDSPSEYGNEVAIQIVKVPDVPLGAVT